MTHAEADEPVRGSLTDEQRSSLRPSLDVERLEHFIRKAPRWKNEALRHFAEAREPEAVTAALREEGASAEEIAAFERELPQLAEDEMALVVFQVEPPRDPELRQLWDSIEPPAAG